MFSKWGGGGGGGGGGGVMCSQYKYSTKAPETKKLQVEVKTKKFKGGFIPLIILILIGLSYCLISPYKRTLRRLKQRNYKWKSRLRNSKGALSH